MILTKFTNLQTMETYPLSTKLNETAEQMKSRFKDIWSNCTCYILWNGTLLCIDFVEWKNEAYLYN